MKKVLALLLSLVLILIPLSSVASFAEVPAEGYALEDTTYIVYTPEGYNAVAALINGGQLDYNITLANDLVFPDAENNFTTIGKAAPYTGTFDGAGYTISGLQTATDTVNASNKADANNRYRALIGQAGEKCTVKDLTITGSAFYGSEYVSAIIGNATDGDITVSNVHIRNTTIQGHMASTVGNNTAGLCGRFEKSTDGEALFENCTIDATIRCNRNAAGICGGDNASAVNVTIRNCVVAGEIETVITKAKNGATGGFFGWTNGMTLTIENSACIATLKSACNECGFVNSLARASTITMTNSIGLGKAFGNFNKDTMTVTFTGCASIDLDADRKEGTSTSLWATLPASAVPGTLTIDGTPADFLTATMHIASIGELKSGVEYLYKDNAELLAKATELVDAMVLKHFDAIGYQSTKIDDVANTFSIRLVGALDAHYTQFSAVGCDVAYTDPDSNVYGVQEVELTTVYKSILANEEEGLTEYTAEAADASYLFALTLKDIPAVGTCTITVAPFVKVGSYKWTGAAYALTFTNGVLTNVLPA